MKATITGLIEFDFAKRKIHLLQVVTDRATYGNSNRPHHFGVAVQLVSSEAVADDSNVLNIKTRRRVKAAASFEVPSC